MAYRLPRRETGLRIGDFHPQALAGLDSALTQEEEDEFDRLLGKWPGLGRDPEEAVELACLGITWRTCASVGHN